MNRFSRWLGIADAGPARASDPAIASAASDRKGVARMAGSEAESRLTLAVAGRVVPVVIIRSPRARRVTLRADAVGGVVRVSLPVRAPVAEAERFVVLHHDWIAARVARWPVAAPFAPGAAIPFDGGQLTLDWAAGRPRGAVRVGDRLVLGGPEPTVAGRTQRWLRAAALADLAPATTALAAHLGRSVTVAVRDPATRWGSCARSGAINYSWRLILAPASVRQSVVAHEVAHLVHPNHGAAFWTLAGELTDGDLAASRAWLRAHGAALHWVGREA